MLSLIKRPALYAIDHLRIRISRRYGDARFSIPLVGRRGLGLTEPFEPDLLAAFSMILPHRDGHFIDIGANIGQTLLTSRSVAPHRPYLGFEPNVVACGYCQELIWANRFTDTVVLPMALGETDGILPLNLRDVDNWTDSSASLISQHKNTDFFSQRLFVSVRSGDGVIDDMEIDDIAAIKIDTEGTEPAVLRGLSATIEKYRPIIFLEILGFAPSLNADQRAHRLRTAAEVETWARSAGYRLSQIGAPGELVAVRDVEEFLPTATGRNFVLQPA